MRITPDRYFTELCGVMADAERLLHAEWAGARFDCCDLAVFILSIKAIKKHKGEPKRDKITPLKSSAKKFLAELETHRQKLLQSTPHEIIDYFKVELDQIDAANKAVSVLIERPQLFNPAQEMGRRLIETCKHAGIALSSGKKEDAPYCRIVTGLLAIAGIHKAPETVLDMLRGRAHRPRSGKHRADGEAENAPSGGRGN